MSQTIKLTRNEDILEKVRKDTSLPFCVFGTPGGGGSTRQELRREILKEDEIDWTEADRLFSILLEESIEAGQEDEAEELELEDDSWSTRDEMLAKMIEYADEWLPEYAEIVDVLTDGTELIPCKMGCGASVHPDDLRPVCEVCQEDPPSIKAQVTIRFSFEIEQIGEKGLEPLELRDALEQSISDNPPSLPHMFLIGDRQYEVLSAGEEITNSFVPFNLSQETRDLIEAARHLPRKDY